MLERDRVPAEPPPSVSSPAATLLSQLDFLVGVWDCEGEAEASHLGASHPLRSSFELRPILDGQWYQLRCVEARTRENQDPIEVVNHWGYDVGTRSLVRTFHASTGAWGTARSDGFTNETLVWLGEIHQRDGVTLPLRQTVTRTGDNTISELCEVRLDGAWVVRGRLSCRRRVQ